MLMLLLLVMLLPPNECMRGSFHLLDPPAPAPVPVPAPPVPDAAEVACEAMVAIIIDGIDLVAERCLDRVPPPTITVIINNNISRRKE